MKRIAFATPEELVEHCLQEDVSLVIEYKDETNKQRQVVLTKDQLAQAPAYLSYDKLEVYYRKDGIFFEVVAEWKQVR